LWKIVRRPAVSLCGATLVVLLMTAAPAGAAVRKVHGAIGGFAYQVLLPAGYDAPHHRRYPVVYVVTGNGGNETSAASYLKLADYAARDQAIIVTPAEFDLNNLITDWADGSNPLDRNFAGQLVPTIDATFRTIHDRAHRAIAGVSAGGYSSMAIAARHPDLFVAAGAFSGVVDIRDRGAVGEATVELPQVLFVDMKPDELFRRFGNPYVDPLLWAERNPTDLARNLHAMSLYAAAGDGVPSDAQEVSDAGPGLPVQMFVEHQIASMTQSFVSTLHGARIPIVYRPHGGTHDTRYWIEDLSRWWPQMLRAFGSPPPAAFDFRSASPSFSVWGWTFTATQPRAPEFLDITHASRSGVTLTGSGTERVTTAHLFAPGTHVSLSGAVTSTATAGRDGRVSFSVNLGAPHQAEQFTSQANQETFVTRSVRFRIQTHRSST
jgi:S-formylglutathione hydrolase FrmB